MEIARKLSDYNRMRKFRFFMSYFKPDISKKIIDIGASGNEYQRNANIIEKNYPYQENVTALSIEDLKEFNQRYPKVRAVKYAGGGFPFHDKEFDLCWSNAVIEHVKHGEEREIFLKEIQRVSKAAFITTPNRFFPFEVHTKLFLIHWLPKKIFDRILAMTGSRWATGDYMNLMKLGEIKELLKKCGITNYKIVKNRILGFTVDFVIIF